MNKHFKIISEAESENWVIAAARISIPPKIELYQQLKCRKNQPKKGTWTSGVSNSVRPRGCWDLTDVTLADKDTNW